MDPHRSFSNSIVKRYCGEDTKGGALWENNTMSKFFFNNIYLVLRSHTQLFKQVEGSFGSKKIGFTILINYLYNQGIILI